MSNIFTKLTSSLPSLNRRTTARLQTDDWIDDLKKETSGEISEKSRQDANKALEEASKEPQTLSQSIKEMQKLVKDGNDLDTRLLEVQHLVEKANLPSKAEAKDLREAYVDLLWNSRSIAGSAKGAADDFRGDMIDLIMMDDISFDEKIAELVNWNNTTLIKGQAAIKQPGEFQRFIDKLKDYGIRVEKEIHDKETEAKKKMDALAAQVAALIAEVDSLTVDVVGPIIAYLKLGAGAFAGVASGSPVTAFAAILKAVAAGVPELMKFDAQLKATQKRREEIYAQIDVLKAQIRTLEGEQLRIGDASAVPSSIKDIADGITDFAGRMTQAINSFSQLSDEQAKIQDFLKKETPISDPLFVSQVKMLKEVLSLTSKLLDIYNKAPLSN